LESHDGVLSNRELEVARLATQGLSTREIASSLFVSVPTVKSHLREIFRKCGVRNRVGLTAWWFGQAGEEALAGQRPSEAAVADPQPGPKAARANGRRKVLVLAGGLAAAIAAIVSWQVYGGPLALGAGDSPPPPPPLGATMGEGGSTGSWGTANGVGLSVSHDANCRLAETRLPGDGWSGLSLLSPEEDITEAEATRGWVQQGVYDCDYAFAVTASDGRAFSIPGIPSQCYQATRSVTDVYGPAGVDRYGWYDGIIWCDEAPVWAYLNASLEKLGLERDTGDP